jgi:predicted AlkP superfamily pyrophosphatase or phosphodiesterase
MKFLVLAFLFLSFHNFGQISERPKLVVGIVVDQMCYDYLYRFEKKYCKDGLLLLRDKGVNCRNVNYDYVPTYTGPGHASIYTGTTPATHGIVGNDWYDVNIKRSINCVEDTAVLSVGTSSLEGKCSPRNLKVHTITDQLKLSIPGAKVISMSIKDRGAILPGGHLSDGSYWYDYASGNFITSTFFRPELPEWVTKFNANGYPEAAMSGIWDTYLPIDDYTESDEDDRKYEHLLPGSEKPTFPYDLKAMLAKSGSSPYDLFTSTPFANNYLTDFALEALKNEGLGLDEIPDMLCISYSSPDIIGHSFGPYSKEIEDTYIRLDLEIARLIQELERTVGKKNFVLFLTADHAVVPIPQFLTDNGLPGGYFFLEAAMNELRAYSISKYGRDLIEEQDNLNVYLNSEAIEELKLDHEEVANDLAAVIREWDEVKGVYTARELRTTGHSDKWKRMVSKGYHKEESGDIIFILEAGYLPKTRPSETTHKGTSHGSAYSYDTHVPLLWYGGKLKGKGTVRPMDITDISATLTHIFKLQQPSNIEGTPIFELFVK